MSSYSKPKSPLYHKEKDTYFYPLTTADQVIMEDGSRLNGELSKHLKVDMKNANEAEPNGINADKLGGYDASEYLRKDQSSVEVNYRVVNNLTKPESEDSLTQNMIWIDTDVPIGRVFFGNNKPNETFIEGDVWICTGDSSCVQFNALRIGNDYMNMVYPLYAKQYISDAWVDKTAKSYQNGEWVDWWNGELYKNGNQFEAITGGWVPGAWYYQSGDSTQNGTYSLDGQMSIVASGGAKCLSLRTTNKIDLSKYSKITVDAVFSETSNEYLVISDSVSGAVPRNYPLNTGRQTFDLSGFPGKYYVGVLLRNDSAVNISEISLGV